MSAPKPLDRAAFKALGPEEQFEELQGRIERLNPEDLATLLRMGMSLSHADKSRSRVLQYMAEHPEIEGVLDHMGIEITRPVQ